jgi:hypothetical protein
MALGNIVWLCALALADARGRREALIWSAGLGFVTGVAFWVHWLIAYYLAAAGGFLVLRYVPALLSERRRPAGPGLPLAAIPTTLAAFLLGSAPFWLYNLRTDWSTFRYFWEIAQQESPKLSKAIILGDWFSIYAPRVLGLSAPGLPWLPVLTAAPCLVALLFASARTAGPWLRAADTPLRLIPLFAISMPLLYVVSGFGASSFAYQEAGVDATGRYVVPLFAAVPLAVAYVYHRVSRGLGLACLSGVMLVSVVGIWSAPAEQVFQSPYYNRAPASFERVIAALHEAGVSHVWTDVGLAHPLMFQAGGRVLAADYLDRIHGGVQRFPAATRAVEEAARTAYLVPVLPGVEGPLERELQRVDPAYQKREIGGLALFLPTRRVTPEEVQAGLGYQY